MKESRFKTRKNQFEIISYGNGAAYSVTCNATGKNLFVQGDEAMWLQDETDDFKEDALAEIFAEIDE